MLPTWVAKYIGIPFKSGGRDEAGCDCYGLVRLVLEREFGVVLPLYANAYADALDHDAIGALISQELPLLAGRPLDGPDFGAVGLYRFSGKSCHLALCVGDGMILHARDGQNGSTLERLDAPSLAGHQEGFYHVH